MTASDPKPDWTDPDVPLGAGIDFTDPNGPLARFYLSASQLAAVLLIGLMTLFVALVPLAPSDIWGHLAYGRWIVEHGRLPDREPLNPYTDKSAPMFHPDWGAKVGYHLLFRLGERLAGGQLAGGVEAVIAGHAAAVGLTLTLLLVAYRRTCGSRVLSLSATSCVFALTLALLTVQRPQGLGAVCFAATLAAVAGDAPARRAWLVVPGVFVAWSNVHGSWIAGLMLLVLLTVGRGIDARTLRDPVLRQRLLLLALAAMAVMLNPYGPTIYAKVVRFSGHPNLATVGEWQPLDLDGQRGAGILYITVLGVVLTAFAISPKRVTAGELLVTLTFAAWPLFQQRGMFWWLLVMPTVALPHFSALAAARGWSLPASVPSFRKTLLVVLLMILGVMAAPVGQWVRGGGPRTIEKATAVGTPVGLPAGLWDSGAVFSDETTGEYLQWAAPSDKGPMLFTHAHLFPARHWGECVAAVQGNPLWPELLDRYRVGVIVLAANTPMAEQVRAHPDWSVVGSGRPLVAVRKPAGGKP